MGQTLTCFAGVDRAWTLQARLAGGGPVNPATFQPSDLLSASVWPGGGRPAVFAPAVAWADPTQGTVTLTVPAAATAAIEAGTYFLRVEASRGSQATVLFDGLLRVIAGPGTAAPVPTYGTYADMKTYAAWIDDLRAESDSEGFASERGRARSWLDDIIMSRSTTSWSFPAYGPPFYGVPPSAYYMADRCENKWLRDQLAANLLIVRDKTVEIVSRKAIGLVCAAQLGERDSTTYQALAARYEAEAANLVKTYRAELDMNGDGYSDITINLGSTTFR